VKKKKREEDKKEIGSENSSSELRCWCRAGGGYASAAMLEGFQLIRTRLAFTWCEMSRLLFTRANKAHVCVPRTQPNALHQRRVELL
jgi:hypothetical protein